MAVDDIDLIHMRVARELLVENAAHEDVFWRGPRRALRGAESFACDVMNGGAELIGDDRLVKPSLLWLSRAATPETLDAAPEGELFNETDCFLAAGNRSRAASSPRYYRPRRILRRPAPPRSPSQSFRADCGRVVLVFLDPIQFRVSF